MSLTVTELINKHRDGSRPPYVEDKDLSPEELKKRWSTNFYNLISGQDPIHVSYRPLRWKEEKSELPYWEWVIVKLKEEATWRGNDD